MPTFHPLMYMLPDDVIVLEHAYNPQHRSLIARLIVELGHELLLTRLALTTKKELKSLKNVGPVMAGVLHGPLKPLGLLVRRDGETLLECMDAAFAPRGGRTGAPARIMPHISMRDSLKKPEGALDVELLLRAIATEFEYDYDGDGLQVANVICLTTQELTEILEEQGYSYPQIIVMMERFMDVLAAWELEPAKPKQFLPM